MMPPNDAARMQAARDYYDNHDVADETAKAELEYHDPRDPAYIEFAKFFNAVSRGLCDDADANGYGRPRFSTRRRIAGRAWKQLHPDSPYGYGAPGEPK